MTLFLYQSKKIRCFVLFFTHETSRSFDIRLCHGSWVEHSHLFHPYFRVQATVSYMCKLVRKDAQQVTQNDGYAWADVV